MQRWAATVSGAPGSAARAQQRSITRWPFRAVAVTGPHVERGRAPGVSLVTFGTGNLPGQWSIQRGELAFIRASATYREGTKPFTRISIRGIGRKNLHYALIQFAAQGLCPTHAGTT